MAREMLINVAESEECRVAVVEGGTLEELYVERASLTRYVGNIYKGRVVNIEPAIQAAFVDFGVGKNGYQYQFAQFHHLFSSLLNDPILQRRLVLVATAANELSQERAGRYG